jgi:hypothetical protein
MFLNNTTPQNTKDIQTNAQFTVMDITFVKNLSTHEPFFERFCESTKHLTDDQRYNIIKYLTDILNIRSNNFSETESNNPYQKGFTWRDRRWAETLFYKFFSLQLYIDDNNLNINYEFILHELVDLISYKNNIAPKEGLHNFILISKPCFNHTYENIIKSFSFSSENNYISNRDQQTTASFCTFIKSFIANIIDVSVNFTSLNKLDHSTQKIYSTLNSNFCNNFKLDEVPVLPDNFVTSTSYQLRSIFFKTGSNLSASKAKSTFFNNPELPSISLSEQYFSDRDVTTTDSLIVLNTFNSLISSTVNILFPERNQFQTYHIPSLESKSAKTPEFKTVTKNFLSKRKGLFVPVLTKAFSLNENNELEEIQILSLLNFTNKSRSFPSRLSSYKNMSKAFLDFIEKYTFENGLFFKNPEEALEKYNSRFKNVLNYTIKDESLLNSKLSTYLDYYLDVIAPLDYSYDSLQNVFDLENTKKISYSYQRNPILIKKENKLKLKFNKLKNKIKEQKIIYANISRITSSIRSKLKQKYLTTSLFYKELNSSQAIDFNFYTSYNKLNVISNKLQKEIQQDKIQKINSNLLQLDPFFLNLKENKISLLSIEYVNKNNETVLLNKQSFAQDNFSFTQEDVSRYNEVQFIIDKPIPIYVDSKTNPKAIKVGGPYIVKVTESSLRIKLKDKNSFFAIQNGSILIHPHAGSVSNSHLFDNYANACLGEASPLIFSAFKNTNLKLIIISALTWVNSANSADTWGRRYVSFIDYDLFDFDQEFIPEEHEEKLEENLTKNETESIITILNDTIEEEDSQEQENLTQMTTSNRLSEEEFTSTPETYTSYSSRASLWTD